MEAAIAIVGGVAIILVKEAVKVIKIKKEKNRIKKNLINAFNTKNIPLIKKYIGYMKDFDAKYGTNKTPKYLDKIIRHNTTLNENNVLSLLVDYTMSDRLYDEDRHINPLLQTRLDEKLAKMEQRRKETMIRENKLNQKIALKNKKISKNKKQKRKSGGMG